MANIIFHIKRIIDYIKILKMKIVKVPKSKFYPEGIKYSLTFIRKLENGEYYSEYLRYNNHNQEGHHKHIRGLKLECQYSDLDTLIKNFLDNLKMLLTNKGVFINFDFI